MKLYGVDIMSPPQIDKLKKSQRYFEYEANGNDMIMKLKEVKAIAVSDHILKIFSNSNRALDAAPGDYCSECKSRFILLFRKRHSCLLCFEDYCNKYSFPYIAVWDTTTR